MSKKPFRFSVCSMIAPTGEEWLAKVRRVEELGYSALVLPEHFMGQVSPIPALAAAAAVTTRLRLGTIVLNNELRNPLLLAKEAATIDWLSNGRFELGLGAGWISYDFLASGIPFDPPKVRVSRLIEAVRLIKRYFGKRPITFNGKYYKIDGTHGLDQVPAPVQKPHPPIMIGAGGPRLLSFAARHADAISITFRTGAEGNSPDEPVNEMVFNQKIDLIKAKAGSRFDQIELNIVTWGVYITHNMMGVVDELSRSLMLSPMTLLSLPYALIGSVEQIAGKLEVMRNRFGLSHYTIAERDMEVFAPILEQLKGQ